MFARRARPARQLSSPSKPVLDSAAKCLPELRGLPVVFLAAALCTAVPGLVKGEGAVIRAAKVSGTAQDGGLTKIYRDSAPAIVAITCRGKDGEYVGSGTIIDPLGLVLTSATVVPSEARRIRVYLRGGADYPARLLKSVESKEFSLLRIRARESFPAIRVGDSDGLRIGQTSLTLGNAVQSILLDDRVSLGAGIVSGSYTLRDRRPGSLYTGPVIETTATVHDYMDGGPLLNSRGEVVGLLSLNFSIRRWLGTAIPVNALKPLFGEYRKWYSDRREGGREGKKRYFGLELVECGVGERRVEVSQVYPDGPAHRAGMKVGQTLKSANGTPVPTVEAFRAVVGNLRAGQEVRFVLQETSADSSPKQVEVVVTSFAKL